LLLRANSSTHPAIGGGYGAKDFSAMVDVLCEAAGIEKPRLKG
jgi:hypothetical protein